MSGRLFGVGVGPGDPELMTIKAVRIIENCEAIAIPASDTNSCTAYNIASQLVKSIEDKIIITVDIPMTKDKDVLNRAYSNGIYEVEKMLIEGKDVAFINLGDPTVYSTYMGIHEKIVNDGFEAEIINGVPSFCAVAGKLGISLAKAKESIHIYPASYDNDDMLKADGTKILMKSGKKLADIKEKIKNSKNIEAYAVTDCTMDTEKVYMDISELDTNAGYFTTVIVREMK